MRMLKILELGRVSGGETTLREDIDGLHVYMTNHYEKFTIGNLTLRSDGTYDYNPIYSNRMDANYKSHQFQIIEVLQENGIGLFHAKIW